MSAYASGKKARGLCDRCGFAYKLHDLRFEIVKHTRQNMRVCNSCWDPDHPQLMLGELPLRDPQAIRDARPDGATFPESRAQIIPVMGVRTAGSAGYVTIQV